MDFILKTLLSGVSISVAAWLVPGVTVESLWTAILAAIVISVVNALVGRLLRILTLPLNILTLGLMSFIISVIMILIASAILPGFETGGFLATALFAIILSLVNMIFGVKSSHK